jgi:hypothetical protein
VVDWKNVASVARAVLTFRYGVLGYVALIGVVALAVLVAAMYLHATVVYLVVFLIVFFAVLGAILLVAFKRPELALMGGPELPPASKIAAIMNLLNPTPVRPEDRVIETDPRRPLIDVSPIEVAKSDREA